MRTALLLIPALAAGCSPAPEPDRLAPHPVRGKVLYAGQPAVGVVVALIPSDAPAYPDVPRNPRAVTAADGTFAVGTFADADGAPEGGYQIVLKWPGPKNEDAEGEMNEETDKLLGWYDGTHSTLSYRVKAGDNAIPVFNLPKADKPPPHSKGVPGRN